MGGTTGPWNEAGQWPILVHMRGPRLLRGVHGTGTSGGSGCEMNWEISSGVYIYIYTTMYKIGLLWWLRDKESACQCRRVGEVGLIPELERSPGEGRGNPLQ